MKSKMHRGLWIVLTILSISCSENNTKFSVKGTIENATGKYISLHQLTQKEKHLIDSVKINESGNFEIRGNTNIIGIYQLTLNGLTVDEHEAERIKYINLIIQPKDKIEVVSKLGSFGTDYVVYGSADSKKVQKLITAQHQTMEKITGLSETYYDALENKKGKIDSVKQVLDTKYEDIVSSHKKYSDALIEEDYASLANIMVLYQRLGIRQTVYNPLDDLPLFVAVDSALRNTYPQAEAVIELSKEVAQVKQYLESQTYQEALLGVGKTPPEIALPNPDGDTIRLSSTRGNIVLLDFWASWCGPCREENPFLVKAYEDYKKKGFEIYQVSLDRTRHGWTSAIKNQNLTWINVSDLKYYDSPVAKTYGIQRIPTNFLLDKEGKIIAKDIRGAELEARLKELFNSKK